VQNLLSSSLISKHEKTKIYRTIILPVVFYGCETRSLTLREEHRPRVFGPRSDEVIGEWRRLRNEELNDLHSSPDILRVIKSRIMGWSGHVARMGERRGACRILVSPRERNHLEDQGVDGSSGSGMGWHGRDLSCSQ